MAEDTKVSVNRILSLGRPYFSYKTHLHATNTPKHQKYRERESERATDGGGKVRVALTNISQKKSRFRREKQEKKYSKRQLQAAYNLPSAVRLQEIHFDTLSASKHGWFHK